MKTRRILSGISALVIAATMAVPFSAFAEDTAINTNGGSGNTNVIYDATEKYFVTIPAGVALKDTAVTADITASNVIIEEKKVIKVTLSGADNTASGNLFSAKNSAKNSTINYNINNGAVSVGTVIAEFDKDNLTKTLTFTKTDDATPTRAGKHSENLTFTIGVEDAKTDVSSVAIDDKSTTALIKGGTLSLSATVDTDATDKTITWKSSDDTVASVDNTGKVTANKSGTAVITVTATNGTEDTADDKTDTITITVTNPANGITLNKTALALTKGSNETLTATVDPTDADGTVSWSSNNTSVATVDSNGKVTAVATGTATITATIGDKSAACEVTVTNPATGITLNSSTLALKKGNTGQLAATVTPNDADNKSVTWTSSNTNVATVDSSGKVTAVASGSATITATNASGQNATCAVTVTNPASGITLNKSTLALTKGSNETLTATVSPADADGTVSWSSNNTSVATVDSNGKVTAVAVGTATVTAKAGDKTATCTVTVSAPSETISLIREQNPDDYEMVTSVTGEHFKVTAGYLGLDDMGLTVNKFGAMTIESLNGENITKIELSYTWGSNANTVSVTPGTLNAAYNTISDINATKVTVSSSSAAGVRFGSVKIYYN